MRALRRQLELLKLTELTASMSTNGGPVVMSSCLCKYGEGASFPLQVESLEDGVDDAVHALDIDKAHHRPGSPSNFYETAFDHIRRPQLAPQVPGEGEEGKQLGQIALQPPHHAAVVWSPAGAEATKRGFGLPATLGQVRWPAPLVSPHRSLPCELSPEYCASCAPSSADAAPGDTRSESPPLNPDSRR